MPGWPSWIARLVKRPTTSANHFFPILTHWFFGKLDALDAVALPPLRTLAQLAVNGSDPKLYQAPAVPAKVNKKAAIKDFRVFVAAMADPDKQRRPGTFRSMLSSVIRDATTYYPSSTLISFFLTDTGVTWSRGCVVDEIFRADVANRFEQVFHTSYIVIASFVTKSTTRKRFRIPGEDSVTAPPQHFVKLADQKGHRIGWTV